MISVLKEISPNAAKLGMPRKLGTLNSERASAKITKSP